MYLVRRQSFRQQFAIRAWITDGGKDRIQDDIPGSTMVGMVEVGGVVGLFVRIGREDMLCRIVCQHYARAVFANQPDNRLTRGLAIGEVAIGKA